MLKRREKNRSLLGRVSPLFLAVLILVLSGCPRPPEEPPIDGGQPSGPVILQLIRVIPEKPSISIETKTKLSARGFYSDGTSIDLTSSVSWSSSNTAIATVDANGLAVGLAEGKVIMTAVSGPVRGTTELQVSKIVSLSVSPMMATIAVGSTEHFKATGTFIGGSMQDITSAVTWSLTPANLATINSAGLVRGVFPGIVVINASFQGTVGQTSLQVAIPKAISVTYPNPFVFVGDTAQFTATGEFISGATQNMTDFVTWRSTNINSLAISNVSGKKGVALGLLFGYSTIVAELGSVSGQTSLLVTPGALTALTIDPIASSMAKGTKRQFMAKGTFGGTTIDMTPFVTWGATATTTATIAPFGVVTAVAKGDTTIQAAFRSKATSTPLTVTNATLMKVSLTPIAVSIPVDVTQQFMSTGVFFDSSTGIYSTQDLGLSVVWSSTSPATIGGTDGLAKGRSLGTAMITATATFGADPKIFGSTELFVTNEKLIALKVTPTDPVIPIGASQQFKAIGIYASGASEDLTRFVTWRSTGNVASISSAGLATGSSAGTSTITASFGLQTTTSMEVVPAELVSISVIAKDGDSSSIPVGITRQYEAFGQYNNGFAQNLTNAVSWGSSDSAIATIDNAGLATAISSGTTTITATSQNITCIALCAAKLEVNAATLQSISVDSVPSGMVSIGVGTTLQYVANANYTDPTTSATSTYNVTVFSIWHSSDNFVATINGDGLVTATANGTTTIIADFGVQSGSSLTLEVKNVFLCSIDVTPAAPSIPLGETQQFSAEGIFKDDCTSSSSLIQDLTTLVHWQSSSSGETSTVSNASGSEGLATSVKIGDTEIKAVYGSRSGTTTLNVKPPVPQELIPGKDHTCARLGNGAMRCWGGNSSGQLGDNNTKNTSTPVEVTGNLSAVLMAAGGSHTCAVLENGTINCWGNNTSGQLGNGFNTQSKIPVRVSGVLRATALTAGLSHTCAILESGAVKCWGENLWGQLGNMSNDNSNIPVSVSNIVNPEKITAGGSHTCALFANQSVQCWGKNNSGQLGNGSNDNSNAPVPVAVTATSISAGGAHTCAVLPSMSGGGDVWCWGDNSAGQLGDGTTNASPTPRPIVGGTTATSTSISAGGSHTCVLLSNTKVQCWGDNSLGQLGNGTTTSSTRPVNVLVDNGSDLSGVRSIFTGRSHTCALLLSGGGARCWGLDGSGQLGDDVEQISPNPILIPEVASSKTVGAGAFYSCVGMQDGTVKCMGNNQFGQLGDGTTNSTNIPVGVSAMTSASALGIGRFHACAILSGGNVQCWGSNSHGKLGNGKEISSSTPVSITIGAGNVPATSISAGGNHTCAALSDGSAYCWGNGSSGQLGMGGNDLNNRFTPALVSNLSSVRIISAGDEHTCALWSPAGAISCWGENGSGQLGNGTDDPSTLPVQISEMTAMAIAAGGTHTCAILLVDNTVKCWGKNSFGQLGDGTTTERRKPVLVSGISTAIAITAGYTHTCALLSDTTVKCWGDNHSGQLGNGSTSGFNNTPQLVKEVKAGVVTNLTGVIAVSAGGSDTGESQTCALISDGTMKCWGDNAFGQIGSNLKIIELLPVLVQGLF